MSPLIKYLLKTSNKRQLNSDHVSGFTMVELLVATIMSFLIITPILAFAVNILESDVREQAKASTELELQSAMDYIQQDISQAFYIYKQKDTVLGTVYDTQLTSLKARLPQYANASPILIFWKRLLIPDSLQVTGGSCYKNNTDLTKCDDSYVNSLVAYYLVTDTNSKWCQPGSGNCPKRIVRMEIQDGVKSSDGSYVCDKVEATNPVTDMSLCTKGEEAKFKMSPGFNVYNSIDPMAWQPLTDIGGTATDTFPNKPTEQVLVNYINDFKLEDTTTTNDLAIITIKGDALRRNEAKNADCDPAKKSPYCPSVSGQIRGMSGFGQ